MRAPASRHRALARGVVLALALLAACGDGEAPSGAQAFVEQLAADRPTKRIAAVAPGVDAEALLDWAEWKYPALFPKGARSVRVVHEGMAYTVRAYPNETYVGVSRQNEIWGLGPFTNGRLTSFGPLVAVAAQVQADRCAVYGWSCAAGSPRDGELRALLAQHGISGDPTVGRTLPDVADTLPQLGKLLFFSKSLSLPRDTACASCHHPALGGGDRMGLPVGSGAARPEVLGPGRKRPDGALLVPRNTPTFFNAALYDRVLFHDGRVQSLAAEGAAVPGGAGGAIRTPDSSSGGADPAAGPNLLAAQARFPIVGAAEMRGSGMPGASDDEVRRFIASRLASEAAARRDAGWLPLFRRAFGRPGASAAELITFDNIALAIAEYERSAVFVKSPWQRYVLGDNGAIGDDAKFGAIVFLTPTSANGTGCVQCHKGSFFTDEKFHPIGFPQSGPGFDAARSDSGRERAGGSAGDRAAFRTPGLLNVQVTAPYGHAGNIASLFFVFRHYARTGDEVAEMISTRRWCRIAGYAEQPGCTSTVGDVRRESTVALQQMTQRRTQDPANALPDLLVTTNLDTKNAAVEAFLKTLTDPCVLDRACLAPWIPRPDEAPDAYQLDAVDQDGQPL